MEFTAAAAAAAKSLQSCPTLCDPIDGSPPGSPIPGILQARTLEWVAISSSNAWKWKVKVKSLSRSNMHIHTHTAGTNTGHELETVSIKQRKREFPDSLVVRTESFHFDGLASTCGWGSKIPQAAQHGQ